MMQPRTIEYYYPRLIDRFERELDDVWRKYVISLTIPAPEGWFKNKCPWCKHKLIDRQYTVDLEYLVDMYLCHNCMYEYVHITFLKKDGLSYMISISNIAEEKRSKNENS